MSSAKLFSLNFLLCASCLGCTVGIILFYTMDRTDSYSKHLLEGYEDGLSLLEAQNLDLLHRIENEAEIYQNPKMIEFYQNAEHAYAKARYIDSLISELKFNRKNAGLISVIDSELVSFQQYHKPVFEEAPTFGSIQGINLDEFPVKLNLSNLEHVEKNLFEMKVMRYRSQVRLVAQRVLTYYFRKVYAPYCGFDSFMPVIAFDRSLYHVGDTMRFNCGLVSGRSILGRAVVTMNGKELDFHQGKARIKLPNLPAGNHQLLFEGRCQHLGGTIHNAAFNYTLVVKE